MERFQTAAEQRDEVNGHGAPVSPPDEVEVKWTPPKAESGGSDSCEGTMPEPPDLRGLKSPGSGDEEDKEEAEEALPTKGLRGDQKKRQREGQEEENDPSKKSNSASSSYTGKDRNVHFRHPLDFNYLYSAFLQYHF